MIHPSNPDLAIRKRDRGILHWNSHNWDLRAVQLVRLGSKREGEEEEEAVLSRKSQVAIDAMYCAARIIVAATGGFHQAGLFYGLVQMGLT